MMTFDAIYDRAAARKGGSDILEALLPSNFSADALQKLSSDRVLSMMTMGIFQSGFVWRVIEQKWPGFEEVFRDFNIETLYALPTDEWDAMCTNTKIVRNAQKIRAVYENMLMIRDVESEKGIPFAQFLEAWPCSDLVGLWDFLKRNGCRLGGMTGQYFLRRIGKDSFMLSKDVVRALQDMGADIKDMPTSKREHQLIQDLFNQMHHTTGRSYTSLSRILSFSTGENYQPEVIRGEIDRFEKE